MSVAYFVRYAGLGPNREAFDRYYTETHAPLLLRFPGIESLTLYTPATAMDSFPVNRDQTDFLARMDFADEAALRAALASDARARAREDFGNLPLGSATVTHQAMVSRRIG